MSTRETFSTPIALTAISKCGKTAMIQISTILWPFTMLLVEGSSETRFFRRLSNHVFKVHNFENTKSMRFVFFFQNVQNLSFISKMQQKIRKTFFISHKIAPELVSFNCPY